jgi:hypothetical protein
MNTKNKFGAAGGSYVVNVEKGSGVTIMPPNLTLHSNQVQFSQAS